MKRKNFRLNLASFVVFLLVGVMGVTAAFTAFMGNHIINPNVSTNSAIQAGQAEDDLASVLDPDKVKNIGKSYGKDDKVVLIVTMNENTLIDTYLANPGNYKSFSDYRLSTDGKNAAENLINKQKALYNKIARQVDVTPKYNYVNITNGFAIEIRYGDRKAIDAIVDRANALGTMISEQYDAPETKAVENAVAAESTGIFDSKNSRAKGIAGQGMVAAVLDTGLDWEHIAFDPNHPLFDLQTQLGEDKNSNGILDPGEDLDGDGELDTTLKFTKKYIEDKLPQLTYANGILSLNYKATENEEMQDAWDNGEADTSQHLTLKDVYKNEKVPYVFDYADFDTEVNSHIDNAHGTHVAGIIAGHSDNPKGPNGETLYDKDEKEITGITGVAPQAQLAIFKVFSDYDSGAGSFSILGALEDCVTLGVDVINMSLGATAGFNEDAGSYNSVYEAYERVGDVGISLIVAAGNEYSTGYNSHAGLNLTSNPDSGSVGSPAAYDASFAVASINGVKSQYLEATYNGGTATAYYNESSRVNNTQYNFMEDIWTKAIYNKLLEYVNPKDKDNPKVSESDARTLLSYVKYFMYEDADGTVEREDGRKYSKFTDISLDNLQNVLAKMALVNPKDPNAEYELQIPYVTIPGVGQEGNYAGKESKVTNAIALVSRGQINFEDKLKIATAQKALACIVFNNAAGPIGMQVGDEITIPSCSITMDVAALIKNKDNSGAAYFTINPQKKAGPFMSEFSNWGPLSNLVLKPEISAHGGEIYSAIPGDDTAYSRFSGTSMACPNMAGVVALLRQYMRLPENVAKFELDLNGDGKVEREDELNLMEKRIYQILMSTATIALDEEGNPYSPRKQGAGLADLDRSEASEQFLYVIKNGTELERTKVELGDDPTRDGVYHVEFWVSNVANTAAQYKVSSHVLTEGISSDEKTVTQKAHLLEAYTPTLKVTTGNKTETVNFNNDKNSEDYKKSEVITVPAKSSVRLTYTITLGDEDKEWLANFKNGMYVEGFVCLENENKEGIDLNIPYLAFYGDWTDAPLMDYDIYETSKDEHDDNIDDDDKRYSNAVPVQLIGKVMESGTEFTLPMGQYVFNHADGVIVPDAEEDKCALSFDSSNAMFTLYGMSGFLRGAKKLFWQITDAVTGEVIYGSCFKAARKASAVAGAGGAYFEIDTSKMNFINNHIYKFTCYPVLDWNAEDFESIEDVIRFNVNKMLNRCDCTDKERCIVDEDCQDTNCPCKDNRIRYSWSSNFWYDTDAPFISNTELRVVRDSQDNASYYLDLYLTDNHYIQALGVNYYDKESKKFESMFGENGEMTPVRTQRNATTLVSLPITYLWEQIQEGILYQLTESDNAIKEHPELSTDLTKFKVTIYDYAFNKSYYTIDLMYLYEYLQGVKFGDIGNYNTYENGDKQVEIMTSYNNIPDEDSTMETVTIVEGQKIELMKAVVATPANAWREDFVFTSSAPRIVRVNEETGEIYAEVSEGSKTSISEAVITLTSRVNPRISASLTVKVLSLEEAAKYNIPISTIQATQSLNKLRFKVGGKFLNAGEEYIIELEHDPWYYNLEDDIRSGKYYIDWTSDNPLAATVRPMTPADAAVFGEEYSIFKAVVSANRGSDYYGEYVENLAATAGIVAQIYRVTGTDSDGKPIGSTTMYSAQFSSYVLKEFVTTGNELTEYHGTPTVDPETGYKTLVIPSNLNITSIGSLLFYQRKDIECVILPEGLESIGRGAFAYMDSLRKVVFPSTLQRIDTYAFIATYGLTDDGPTPGLSIVDFTACEKPLQISEFAFANQRYIGVDLKRSKIKDLGDEEEKTIKENEIYLLSDEEIKLFDLKMVRIVGKYAFANLAFVSKLDVTGLRGTDVGAFMSVGSALHQYFDGTNGPAYAEATFGEYTVAGLAAFVGSGIGKIELPMRRISVQMFYGKTVEQEEVHEGEEQSRPDTDTETEYKAVFIGELEEITFTSDDLVIEMGAFIYSSVKKVTFEGTVASIGDGAFLGSKLEQVEFKKECREIGAQAFAETPIGKQDDGTPDGAPGEFRLPAGLKKLGSAAFSECKMIKKIVVDEACEWTTEGQEGLSTIGAPFYGCDALEEFYVEPGNAYMSSGENGALYNKVGDMLIGVPCSMEIEDAAELLTGNVKKIGAYAFAGNTNIKKADLRGIEVLGDAAFYMCPELQEIIIPRVNVPMAFCYECNKLDTITFADAVDTQNPIKTIGDYAFFGTAFAVINVPETVTEIGVACFAENENLQKFTFPTGVTEIKDATFFRCTSLAVVNAMSPGDEAGETANGSLARIKSVGTQAFVYAGITAINLRSCEYVGESAFAGCTKLETVNLPNVTTIFEYTFAGGSDEETGEPVSSALSKVSIPKVTRIGANAFVYNDHLESMSLEYCTAIDEFAFFGCSRLISVVSPYVETIGRLAFANSGLRRYTIAEQYNTSDYDYNAILTSYLKYVHPTAFTATSILGFTFAEDNDTYFEDEFVLYRYIDGGYELAIVPSLYQQTVDFTVLDGTVRIGEYAFYLNQLITRVTIPDSVRWIGDSAFADSAIRLFKFDTLQAPELEAGTATYTTENFNDTYFWQVYNNFYKPFTYMPGVDEYKYSNVRQQAEDDEIVQITFGNLQNDSYVGGGFTRYPYGIIVERPSNAKGFDNFIWANYFDSTVLAPERLEDSTKTIMDLIRALPEPSRVTSSHKSDIESARNRYESIESNEQRAFVRNEGLLERLEACERRLAEITANDITTRQALADRINKLPDPENITLDHMLAVEDARDAYDALSAANRSLFNEEYADLVTKLEECEAKINELKRGSDGNKEGCGSCGTVAFGAGNDGGTGLMIGLFAVMIVSLLVVLLRKKKAVK